MSEPTDDLERWPALTRRVEPLPGGLDDLRRRIAAEGTPGHARLRWLALAGAAALAVAGYLVWSRMPGAGPPREAARALFGGPRAIPHPEAVALGLASPPPIDRIGDPRLSGGEVVFFWAANAGPQR